MVAGSDQIVIQKPTYCVCDFVQGEAECLRDVDMREADHGSVSVLVQASPSCELHGNGLSLRAGEPFVPSTFLDHSEVYISQPGLDEPDPYLLPV
jgi:hypothetical protein